MSQSTRTPLGHLRPNRRSLLIGASLASAAAALAACSGSSGERSSNTLKIAYQRTSAFTQLEDLLTKAKGEFEAANSEVTVELVPIEAEQDQYFTKLALMNGSGSTAPDVMYEDSFQVRSDAAAGYLMPIDEYVEAWEDWDQFVDSAKEAGLGDDGKLYGVSMGTDTRGIYFNKQIFAQAGLPEDWQPTNWNDILAAARTIKEQVPDVIPLNIFVAKAGGEMTSMQGFEMLLSGTDSELLYNTDTQKWVTGSQGFIDSLAFMDTVYAEELGPALDMALDSTIGNRVSTELLPQGRLAMAIDGSWMPGGWISGDNPWPEWEETMGFAKMPTQNGQGDGFTSMSGGWTLAVGSKCANPEAAFQFISIALNYDNTLKYDTENAQVAVRKDVAESEDYLSYNPSFEFFSSLVQYTHFRPTTPDYSQISGNIQIACESVVTDDATPEQAAATYDSGLISIVGEDGTEAAS
ncbi:extracellular solute-binding protein [Actinomyces ruminicola]|uniref:Multiple sugar transport system substrate-binding protein n=1 Tax=Actinomyces ruminicola TaxID=332524 RepID=A0A1G9WYC1_9ACTO|nr:extracellular solute-binding protein [Actinomyces ruminicola]SDM89522.1 multiple sugar transport system substrate-binding protein [Actinomyces ruminicola]